MMYEQDKVNVLLSSGERGLDLLDRWMKMVPCGTIAPLPADQAEYGDWIERVDAQLTELENVAWEHKFPEEEAFVKVRASVDAV